jgi:S-DNA-T family DNA segregation ATPase FtsK/SpoIIIE
LDLPQPRISISPDRKKDLLGILLILISVFTLTAGLSPEQSPLSSTWIQLLRRLFGVGALAVPFANLALGLWLLLRPWRDRLPRLEPEQLLGLFLLYLAFLPIFHALLGPEGSEAGMEFARQGRGGGVLGSALFSFMLDMLGGAGTAILVIAWLTLGLILTTQSSLADMIRVSSEPLSRFFGRLVSERKRSVEVFSIPAEPELSPAPAAIKVDLGWVLPDPQDVLEEGSETKADDEFERQRAALIEETLALFGAPVRVVETNRGPTITQFGVEPDFLETKGGRRTKVKVGKIASLADDLALALAAPSIRVEAPVPGKGYVGIEVPNPEISLVGLRSVMASQRFRHLDSTLALALGQDVSGKAVVVDLQAMPHLLIAGTTGSGKSVCVNSIISCLLLRNTPGDLRFLMIDPKRVELTYYNGIPHLLAPVVVDLTKVVPALQWISREMDKRYQQFSQSGVRNIQDFNQGRVVQGETPMHKVVVVIDELADLMMMAPDETERVITRLAQLARATGIHLVIATQRPSVDVVTGLIKANFPARIAFAVASSVDSRVIIDQPGAERLLGKGDMLLQAPDAPAPIRMQGSFVSEMELNRLIDYWKHGARLPGPSEQATVPPTELLKQAPLWDEIQEQDDGRDEYFEKAASITREMRKASISLLQRRLRIGYTRAARLIDQLEDAGIVGPAKGGSRAREVLDYGELATAEEE